MATRAMLGAEGYDVAKVLRVLDSWMDEAVHGVRCPPGYTVRDTAKSRSCSLKQL